MVEVATKESTAQTEVRAQKVENHDDYIIEISAHDCQVAANIFSWGHRAGMCANIAFYLPTPDLILKLGQQIVEAAFKLKEVS